MKVLKIYLRATAIILFTFSLSCDKIEEAATKDVTVSNVNISISTPVGGDGLRATLTTFAGDTIFDADDFSDLKSYKNYISAIQVLEVGITSSTSGNGTVVENFKAVYNTSNSYAVANYNFGQEHKDDQLKPFVQKLLTDLLINNKEINLSATGSTDESSAKNLTHTIRIAQMKITVKLIDL